MKMRILRYVTVHDKANDKFYRAEPSFYQAKKYDNGALVSCGWTLNEDLPRGAFSRMKKEEISKETYNHSGCMSRCTLRGDSKCQY